VGPFQFRHDLEIHAVDSRRSGSAASATTAITENSLMMLFCSRLDDAEHRIQHEGDLVGEIGGVVSQRGPRRAAWFSAARACP